MFKNKMIQCNFVLIKPLMQQLWHINVHILETYYNILILYSLLFAEEQTDFPYWTPLLRD